MNKIAIDNDNNLIVGTHCGIGTFNCIILGSDDELISTIGIHDCLIVKQGKELTIVDLAEWKTQSFIKPKTPIKD